MEKGKKPVALFIGRFQPFHKGHLSAVRWIAKKSARVAVAIGSAQLEGTDENPFSAMMRKKAVKGSLAEAKLGGKCRVFLLSDINDDARWVAHVDAHLPHYDICYSNNPLVLKLMERAGKKTARVPFLRRSYYNATAIRKRMRAHLYWKARVPHAVSAGLERLGGKKRAHKA